ncbi:MAG: Polysulfide reductase chain A precursor [Spirochaetes bacterium ADurb.Bin218]|jgi:thiosulfate reductase/polysulfide reductase chain A|nr:molybdopterin-dependent oxidoreductase [Spirochaetota bacterium]OQA97020.1 MAG: Polysulfide reductase chain A precursor [Spirochaetes bacterium ADurb.Bin218]HOV09905.1 molybdopterin-dependent oxidoreductase [Spirochaetota bacterium]
MALKVNRREFIKITGAGIGGAAVAGGVGKVAYGLIKGDSGDDVITRVPTFCEMCTFQCAGWAYTKNGKPWKIVGNELDEHCYGRLCTKGTSGFGIYNDPDRLKTPLIRTSERGKQVFREATWDEALTYIADKLKEIKETYGPESVAMFSHGSGGSWFKTLLKAYGTTDFVAPSYANCRGPREEAYMNTYGEAIESPERTDMKNSKCIVLIGSHIGENTHSQQVNEFAQALRNGASLIVVDPRFSIAASKAKYWLPIKPGTDLALLLAWINVIIYEELYDKDYVRRYTKGFEELKKAVKDNTPEWAYPITTISPDVIRETAREMAKHKPSTLIHPGRHNVWYGDDTQRVRAGAILNALLGSWGRKGGFFIPESAELPEWPIPAYPKPKRSFKDTEAGQKYQLANLAISAGVCAATVHGVTGEAERAFYEGWFIYGCNVLKSMPQRENTIKALQNLSLVVVIDVLPTEITGWADVVLPDTSYLERYDDIRHSQGRTPQIALRSPVFEPRYNSKPAWWIARELAYKMGLGDYFPWKDVEEYLDFKLKKIGSSLDEMKRLGVKNLERTTPLYIGKNEDYKFPTDSGKIELYSETLKNFGFDPVPVYRRHDEPEGGYYRLLYGRSASHSFARTINNPILSELDPENEVWVNPIVAIEWGLKNGQYVRLENQDGVVSNKVKVRVTERIRPDSVYMVHGFGSTAKNLRRAFGKGADDQELMTRILVDPIMGGQGMHGNFVTFRV